jgi:hypothetical protein
MRLATTSSPLACAAQLDLAGLQTVAPILVSLAAYATIREATSTGEKAVPIRRGPVRRVLSFL